MRCTDHLLVNAVTPSAVGLYGDLLRVGAKTATEAVQMGDASSPMEGSGLGLTIYKKDGLYHATPPSRL